MPDIPGNSSTGATIAIGGAVTGSLETPGDHDWFRITLEAGQSITIMLSGVGTDPVDDTYLIIRDSAGNQLAFNDDGGDGLNSVLSFTATSAGTYYIDAAAWSDPSQGYYGDIGTYRLSVENFVPPPVFNYDQIADQLVNGFWDGAARHFNVSQGGTITVNLSELNASEQYLARHALQLWSDSLGINFSETLLNAQITFHNDDHDASEDSAFSSSVTSGGFILSSQVNIDSGWVSTYGTGLNSYSFQTYLHEIGHALGLGHAGNYNGSADYPNDALFSNDAWSTTVMSYFSQQQNSYFSSQGFTYDYLVTPMVGDLVAMAMLYGSPTTTRTGNTTYGFNNTSGREVFDASAFPSVAYTVLDNGGIDTLDYSGFGANQRINLNAETFSNVGGGVGNVSIARGTVIENAIGGSGNDTLIGNAANNVLTGNAGNDTLDGGAGNDILNGGAGVDTASYASAISGVAVDLRTTTAQYTRSAGIDTLSSIEQLVGSNFADRLYGSDSANRIDGGAGNDLLIGRGGDDHLIGGAGNDTLDGGTGNDILDGGAGTDYVTYAAAQAGVTVNLSLTGVQNTGGAGQDQLLNLERLYGSNFNDNLTGTAGGNLITGRSGDDVITGGDGYDRLQGDGGNDTIYGDGGNDTVIGGAGNDFLYGGDGNDALYGQAGNDVIDGGNGIDITSYADAAAGVTIDLGVTTAQDTGGAGIDTLSSIERLVGSRYDDHITGAAAAERLIGGAGNDTVMGGAGNDIVQGDAGNDVVGGGAGNDSVYGGAGQDMFRFDSALNGSTNVDSLRDFSSVDDTFQLSQAVFSAIGVGTLDASAFHVGRVAEDASDRIVYDQASGRIYYDADGSGGGAQVLFARVHAGVVLTNADFEVIAPPPAQTQSPAMKMASDMPAIAPVGIDAGTTAVEPLHVPLFTDTTYEAHFIF